MSNKYVVLSYTECMLICYRFVGDASISIGLALNQWMIKGEPRIYVLSPQAAKKYCEVEIIYPPEFEWCLIKSEGTKVIFDSRELNKDDELTFDKETEQDLYYVWDDGASTHPERASRLYDYFKSVIDQNRATALSIKESFFEKGYQDRLKEAKNKGWDAGLISRKAPTQAYDSY